MTLLAATVVISASSQAVEDITLTCAFGESSNRYTCTLEGITVLDAAANIAIVGEHEANRANDDVVEVQILRSNTPFIIPQIFDIFRNLERMGVTSSNLQSISFPENAHLVQFSSAANNISHIENGTFRNQERRMQELSISSSNVMTVDEDAFVGLSNVISFTLNANQITEFLPRTFFPLVSAIVINLNSNRLTRIEEDLFSQNRMLTQLLLSFNQINEIHPWFLDSLPRSIVVLTMSSNACIDQLFVLFDWEVASAALQACYENYRSPRGFPRSITMKIEGPVTFYNEAGNVIARIE